MSFIEAFQPDIFESLCDTVSSVGQANKRIRKSVDRTLQFLDESLQIRQENEVSLNVHKLTLSLSSFMMSCSISLSISINY